MKWEYGSRKIRANARRRKWHKWFAWHPVKISDTEKIWFEVIVRQQLYFEDFNCIQRFFLQPTYAYKESILDIIKGP